MSDQLELLRFYKQIYNDFEDYKQKLNKQLNDLDKILNEEYSVNLTVEEQLKLFNKIWRQQTKINNVRLSFDKVKADLAEYTKTPEDIEKETKQRERTFNGMTAREWTLHSRNVWNDVSSPRKPYHKEHGAVYPYKLVERLISMYSKKGDTIFDPFSGIATTIHAAMDMERNGIGIELNEHFFDLSKRILTDPNEFPLISHCDFIEDTEQSFILKANETNVLTETTGQSLHLYKDDCRNLLKYVEPNSVQALITSPPYADFIRQSVYDREKVHKKSLIKLENNSTVKPYSDDEKDLGNLSYDEFMIEIEEIMKKTYEVIKPGGYAVWVVKDYKDKENFTSYLDFHTDIATAGKKAGFLYHDLIIWDQNEQRSLVLLGYPSKFHTNQNCSFLVVLRKPDEKEMKMINKRRAQSFNDET